MKLTGLKLSGLVDYVSQQLTNFFPDDKGVEDKQTIRIHIDEALLRLRICINAVRLWKPEQFDYLHSSQYCTFLYFLANTIWRSGGDISTCNKLFYLNKVLNGIDCFYEINMPDIFFIGHSSGIVLAKAEYGNHFVIYQNSTVGKNHGIAPVIGERVVMYPNSAIIGRCKVGSDSVLAAGTRVLNTNTPGNCYVFSGKECGLSFTAQKRNIISDIFRA